MQIVQWLRQQLSSGRTVLQAGGGLQTVAEGGLENLWIIARSECVFRSIDISAVPVAKRDGAIATQVSLASPFEQPAYWYEVQSGIAKVWIWNEAARLKMAPDADQFTVCPESCMTRYGGSEVRLYRSVNGCIAQSWSEDELTGDSWWPEPPGDREWRSFLRGIGAPYTELPDGSEIDLQRTEPWPSLQLNRLAKKSLEAVAVRTVAIGFLFLFVFQLTGTLRLGYASWVQQSEIVEMVTAHESALALREEAFALRNRGDSLAELGQTQTTPMLNAVAANVPATNAGLLIWNFENNQLEIVLKDSSPNLEQYIRQLEAVEGLSGVYAEPLSGQVRINAQVSP